MDAKEELRAALCSASDWQACLRERFRAVSQTAPARELAQEAILLARALEAVEPDRLFAVHMYVRAYKCSQDDPQPLIRARQLSREIGNLEFAAKAARLEFVHTNDPKSLYVEGVTWLDADHPERAVQSLGMARQQLPSDDLVTIALATARRQWSEDGTIIEELERRAKAADDPAIGAVYLLYAARILRSLGAPSEEYGRMLLRAFTASPRDESVCALLERFLHARADQDALVELYRRRVDAMTSPAQIVEEYRRAGTRLVLDGRFAGLGLRLLRRGLDCAYEAGLELVPGHLAMHALIRRYAEHAQVLPDYLGLLVSGLDLPLPGLDRLWLGLCGLDIAWNQLGAAKTAYAYAAVVAHHAPEHPLLRGFHASGGLAQGSNIAEQRDGVHLGQWSDAAGEAGDRDELSLGPEPSEYFDTGSTDGIPITESMPEIELDEIFELVAESDEFAIDVSVDDEDVDFELDFEPEPEPAVEPDEADAPAVVIPGAAMAALKDCRAKPPPLPAAPEREDAVSRAPRVAVPADVQLHIGELRLATVSRDVSATGMFLVTGADLDIDSEVSITVRLPGTGDFAVLEYDLRARVARKAPNGYGIEYIDPPSVFVMQISVLNAES